MPKDTFNQTSSSISSKSVGEAQGFATTTHADLNNGMVELYLSFLSPYEIAKIKGLSWGYYKGANQALNHYRLIDKKCQKEVGLKFLKLELSNRQNFLLVQNSQGQSQVYAWGVNGFSQLGLGHNNAVTAPSLLPFPGSLANWMLNNIVASGSGNSAFAIFQNAEGQSQVYAWGANELGQLGLGHNNAVTVPTLLPFPDSLAHWTLNNIVASGSGNSAFAIFQNAEGQSQVYAWGDNMLGRLGLGHDNYDVNRPSLLSFPDSLANWTLNNLVASGSGNSAFAIFQNAEGQKQVYAWGANWFGQLGLEHNNSVHTPTLIPFFKGATGPGQLPLQRRKILGALTGDSEAASSSTAVSSNQSSRSCELVDRVTQLTAELSTQGIHLTPLSSSSSTPSMVNAYLSSQSSPSQTASSSLTAELEQKCVTVTVAEPKRSQKLG